MRINKLFLPDRFLEKSIILDFNSGKLILSILTIPPYYVILANKQEWMKEYEQSH